MIQPISLASTAVTGAEAIQRRRDRVNPVEAYARVQTDLRAAFAERAAVVQFGEQALSLARRSVPSNPDRETALPELPAPSDSETARPRPPAADDTGAPETSSRTEELSAQQQREVQTLERTERQVRADERAQRAAAGAYSDGVQLRYSVGPDGRRYVVAAEVALDVTPVPGDPAATLRKMEAIMRAVSSGSSSISDQTDALAAEQLARRARAQLAAQRYAEAQQF